MWLGGRVLSAARARLPIDERGFLYGDAVFETIRIAGGRALQWKAHERRLRSSLRHFGIPAPRADLARAVADLIGAVRLRDGAVRVTISRGAGEGLLPPVRLEPTVLVTARPLPTDLEARQRCGVAALRLAFGHGRGGIAGGHKTTAYLGAVLARLAARRAGVEEAIYVERDGTVSEATASNVFAVKHSVLHTPPLDGSCLPGVTRATVLRLARGARLRVRERPLRAAELARCDEVFLTSSVQGIVPVVRLDGRAIGGGVPGPITRTLQRRYAAFVARATGSRRAAPRP